MDGEILEEQEQDKNVVRETVETIIQNGVSKDELKEMLSEILKQDVETNSREEIEKAEKEYIGAFLMR